MTNPDTLAAEAERLATWLEQAYSSGPEHMAAAATLRALATRASPEAAVVEAGHYPITGLSPIFALPEDAFARFLDDLGWAYRLNAPMLDLLAACGGTGAALGEQFTWVDDGERHATFRLVEEPAAALAAAPRPDGEGGA